MYVYVLVCVCMCVYMYMHVCMYVCVYLCVHVYAPVFTCACACMCVCMYVCVCACAHAHINRTPFTGEYRQFWSALPGAVVGRRGMAKIEYQSRAELQGLVNCPGDGSLFHSPGLLVSEGLRASQ